MPVDSDTHSDPGMLLFGRRVLVTRAVSQAEALSRLIADRGGFPVELPITQIAPPESWADVDIALANLRSYQWVAFTSTNAVDFFLDRLVQTKGDAQMPAGCHVAAVGPVTAARLAQRGVHVDVTPQEAVGLEIASSILAAGYDLVGVRVLFPRAENARPDLPIALKAAGAHVDEVVLYRTIPNSGTDVQHILDLIRKGGLAAVTVTSGTAVRYLLQVLGGGDVDRGASWLADVPIVAIGPTTAAVVQKCGLPVAAVADPHTTVGVVEALCRLFNRG